MSNRPSACPYCEAELEDGDYIDIGVGMQKISPSFCRSCGATEIGANTEATPEERRIGFTLGTIDQTTYRTPAQKELARLVGEYALACGGGVGNQKRRLGLLDQILALAASVDPTRFVAAAIQEVPPPEGPPDAPLSHLLYGEIESRFVEVGSEIVECLAENDLVAIPSQESRDEAIFYVAATVQEVSRRETLGVIRSLPVREIVSPVSTTPRDEKAAPPRNRFLGSRAGKMGP